MIEEKDINVGTKFTIVGRLPDGTECTWADKDKNIIVFTVTRMICDNGGHIKNIWCDKNLDGEENDGFNELDVPLILGSARLVEAKKSNRKPEQVEHPSHYSWLREKCMVEPIDICRHLDFNIGCAVKYLLRKGKKEEGLSETEQRIQDLKKAAFYLQDEIKLLSDGKE